MNTIQAIKNFNESHASVGSLTRGNTGTQRSEDARRIDPIPLSTSDLLLCAGGFVVLTTSALNRLDTPSSLLSIISKVAAVGMILGELYITAEQVQINASKSLENLRNNPNALNSPFAAMMISNLEKQSQSGMKDALSIVGGKWFVLSMLKTLYNPIIPLSALITTALTAIHTVPRAFQELQKTFQLENRNDHTWEIARNTFVHGFNAAYSLYNIGELFYGLFHPSLPPVFPPVSPLKETPSGAVKTYSEIQIPQKINDTSKCKLAQEISALNDASPQERSQLLDQFMNAYPWRDDKKLPRQAYLLLHPDRNPTCSKTSAQAFQIFGEHLRAPLLELPNPNNHYNHPREIHRIAELPNPASLSETHQMSFACQVLDGICSSLDKTLSETTKNLQTIVERRKQNWLTKTKAQSSIEDHFKRFNEIKAQLLTQRDQDVAAHITHQIQKKQQSFVDDCKTNPTKLRSALTRFSKAFNIVSKAYPWEKAIEGVNCKAQNLTCDSAGLMQKEENPPPLEAEEDFEDTQEGE